MLRLQHPGRRGDVRAAISTDGLSSGMTSISAPQLQVQTVRSQTSFLRAAHASAQVGATILISLPHFEVQHSIREERARLLKCAPAAGPSLLGTYGWTTVESAPLQPEFRKLLANSCGSLLGQGRAYPDRGQEPGSSKAGYVFAGWLPPIFALAVVRRTIHFL